MIDNPDAFKADLKKYLTLYREKDDRWLKHAAFANVLEAFGRFVEAWDAEIHKLLTPALQEYRRGLVDLINGRHSETFTPAPRKGRRPSSAADVQPQARAALYADRRMQVGIDKNTAIKEAARKFKFDAGSVAYWLRQATNGEESARTVIFKHDLLILTAKYPNSPGRQAAFLFEAHRQAQKKFSP